MGKDSAPAPAPDPQIGQAATMNAELGKQWLDFSKEQFATGTDRQAAEDALIKKVVDNQLAQQGVQNGYQDKMFGYQDEQLALAKAAQAKNDQYADKQMAMQDYQFEQGKEKDAYNKATFRPVEGQMVSEAMNYDSPERQEQMAAEAKADVMDGAARAKATSERSMAGMGVNPNSGRFAGITRSGDTASALAAAGAQNQARDKTRDMGIMLRKDAANFGRGMSSTAAQSYGIGMQAGQNGVAASGNPANYAQLGMAAGAAGSGAGATGAGMGSSAVANYGAGQNNFYANNGIMTSGMSGAIGANESAGGMLNNQYGNQIRGYAAQQQANSAASQGIGSLIGTAATAGTAIFL